MDLWRQHRRALIAAVAIGLAALAAVLAVTLAATPGEHSTASATTGPAPISSPAPSASPSSATPTWQLRRYSAIGYDRSFKMDLVDELPEPPQLVVLGGSRCTRFAPAFATKLTGLPGMNLALSNLRPEDAWAMLNSRYTRAPQAKVRVFWGVTANSLTDIPFAPGLVYDDRLSRSFPEDLLAEQKELLGDVPIRDLLRKMRFTARGMLRWNTYDARRAAGLTLDRSLDLWIARYATGVRWAARPSARAKSYFEQTLALLDRNGVKPCIVLMPYHPRALEALKRTPWRRRQDEFKAYLRELQGSYDFRVLNYTSVTSFGGRTRYFYDGAHVTVENARILMARAVRAAPECFE